MFIALYMVSLQIRLHKQAYSACATGQNFTDHRAFFRRYISICICSSFSFSFFNLKYLMYCILSYTKNHVSMFFA